jgi:uncharacterized protein (DUF4415 family)
MPASKHGTHPAWVDSDDAPELTDEFFERADECVGDQVVRRGRPAGTGTKELVSLRIDRDVLSQLRASGRGWQTRANDILRDAVRSAPRVPRSSRRKPTASSTRDTKAEA